MCVCVCVCSLSFTKRCAPTRAAIMTGRYPYNTGMNDYNHGIEEERSSVPVSFDMLPKLLKNAPTPYATHMLGKWHLGFFKHAATPVGRGFDSSFGYFCGDSTHDTRGSQESHTCGMSVTDLYNSTHPANTSDFATNRVYNTHMYAELASELIHAHDQTKPFFLYMAFQNVSSWLSSRVHVRHSSALNDMHAAAPFLTDWLDALVWLSLAQRNLKLLIPMLQLSLSFNAFHFGCCVSRTRTVQTC